MKNKRCENIFQNITKKNKKKHQAKTAHIRDKYNIILHII